MHRPNWPLIGAVEVDAEQVGAIFVGTDPSSRDRSNPGVRISESGRVLFPPHFTLDGGVSTRLTIDDRTPNGFRGSWSTTRWHFGAVGTVAAGCCCAIRTGLTSPAPVRWRG